MFCTQRKLITRIFQNNICIRGRSPRGHADLPTSSPDCLYLHQEREFAALLRFYQSILNILSVGLLLGQNKTSEDVFLRFIHNFLMFSGRRLIDIWGK